MKINLEAQESLKTVVLNNCKLSASTFHSTQLEKVLIYSNQIKMLAMSQMVQSLPDRSAEATPGLLYVVNTEATDDALEKNEFIQDFALAAQRRNWLVYDIKEWENKGDNPYAGTARPEESISIELASIVSSIPIKMQISEGDSIILDHGLGFWNLYRGVQEIAIKPQDKKLRVYGNSLVQFALTETPLQSISFKENLTMDQLVLESNDLSELTITSLKGLELINLSNNKLTKLDLGGLTKLLHVDVSKNQLTQEALDELIKALPDVTKVEVGEDQWKKQLLLQGNPGSLSCDVQPAIDKGWIVQVKNVGIDRPSHSGLFYDSQTSVVYYDGAYQSMRIYSIDGTLVVEHTSKEGSGCSLGYLPRGSYYVLLLDGQGATKGLKIIR